MTNRDKDIRLAKAIGWKIKKIADLGGRLVWELFAPNGHSRKQGFKAESEEVAWRRQFVTPHFTTDMSTAWTLVEKLRAMGWALWRGLKELIPFDASEQTFWIAGFVHKKTHKRVRGQGPTPQQAIVDAALQILEAGE